MFILKAQQSYRYVNLQMSRREYDVKNNFNPLILIQHKFQACIDCYSKKVKLLGKSGSGQLAKMVNQICIGGLLQALAEGINFSEKAGLNTEDVMEVITKGAAQSWYMENRWSTMLNNEYDHGFAVDWMKKDLDIVEDQAKRIGANIQVTQLVNNFYKEIQELDGGRWDASSLLKRIKD